MYPYQRKEADLGAEQENRVLWASVPPQEMVRHEKQHEGLPVCLLLMLLHLLRYLATPHESFSSLVEYPWLGDPVARAREGGKNKEYWDTELQVIVCVRGISWGRQGKLLLHTILNMGMKKLVPSEHFQLDIIVAEQQRERRTFCYSLCESHSRDITQHFPALIGQNKRKLAYH